MTIKLQAISGVKWTTFSAVISTALQMAQLIILARFLSPEELGLIAIIMVTIRLAQAFMDMGISNAIIHYQDITHEQLSSLYWINILAGITLTLLCIFLAPLIASFYQEPALTGPLIHISLSFMLASIGNQYQILFQKDLQFKVISFIEILSIVLSFIVAVSFVILGHGIYSIVFAILVQSGLRGFLFLWAGLKVHPRPSLIFQPKNIKKFFSFGLYQMGERSINMLSTNIDKIIIGKMIGMEAVGFYNMAWQFIIFPVNKINPVINKVAFPIYAKVQHDNTRLNQYYSITLRALSLVTIPLLLFLSFNSAEVVYFLFGEGWESTAKLVSILAITGIFRAIANPGGPLFLALGIPKIGFWWNLIWLISTAASLYIVLRIRPEINMAPIVLLCLSIILGCIWHYMIAFIAKIQYREILIHTFQIIIISFCLSWLSKYLLQVFSINHTALSIAMTSLVFFLLYGLFLYFTQSTFLKLLRKKDT